MDRFLFLVTLFFVSHASGQELHVLTKSSEPDFQAPFCYKDLNADELSTRKYTTVLRLYKATFKDPSDADSVWDQKYLKDHPHVLETIRDFKSGARGQTLKKVNLEGKTAPQLHKELLALGFLWKPVPLRASLKRRTFWLTDGATTKNANHKDIVKLHLYVHKDGSLVRIKAAGIPDGRGRHPRRSAHAIKAVLLNVNPNLCAKDLCQYDTGYQNEAFKVTNDHQPVPKAPSPKYGLKLPKNEKTLKATKKARVIKNVIMNLAHTNLKTSCALTRG